MINVFNIEKFATHDGPGIRTAIFLKGCPLHCPWCANPESWSLKPTPMYDKKTGETKIAGKYMSISEIVSAVLKDKDYFDNSNGGVTISGGEAFVQFEEMFALVKELKKHNLNIAIETTGNFKHDYLLQILPYVDLFLFDIKHLDKEKLFNVTGGNINLIMKNFDFLAQNFPHKIIVRVAVIPGFNDDEKTVKSIIDYVTKYKIKEIDLLPYHSFGANKWEQLNKEYQFKGIKSMEKSFLKKYEEYGKNKNIYVKIGG